MTGRKTMSNTPETRTTGACGSCGRETVTKLYVAATGHVLEYCPECRVDHDGQLETLR